MQHIEFHLNVNENFLITISNKCHGPKQGCEFYLLNKTLHWIQDFTRNIFLHQLEMYFFLNVINLTTSRFIFILKREDQHSLPFE